METHFGIPYSRTGQPYGLKATEEWLMGIAGPLGMGKGGHTGNKARAERVRPDFRLFHDTLDGKTPVIEISEFPVRYVRSLLRVWQKNAALIRLSLTCILIRSRSGCLVSSSSWKLGSIPK